MIYEYALDPALLDNWKDFRFFQQSFGLDQGRLISTFPKKWQREVLSVIKNASCGDVEKKKIKEALKSLTKEKLYSRPARNWDQNLSWFKNALNDHQVRNFQAIIYRESVNGNTQLDDHFIREEDLDESSNYWKTQNTVVVPRNAADMAGPAKPLLCLAQHIIFVDPHFDPNKARFRNTLHEWLKIIASRPIDINLQRIEYHLSDRITAQHLQHVAETKIKPILPPGMCIGLVRHPLAEMHDRHILTNVGALTYGQGLDEGNSPIEVRIQREGIEGWMHLWGKYSSSVPFYIINKS